MIPELTLDRFVPALLQLSIQASLLILLVLALQFVLGRRLPARWRYNLWLLVVLRLFIPFEGPAAPFSLDNLFPATASLLSSSPGKKSLTVPAGYPVHFNAPTSESSVGSQNGSRIPVVSPPVPFTVKPAEAIVALWGCGTVLFLLILAGNARSLWAEIRRARPVISPDLLALFEVCRAETGIRRPVRLLESDKASSPVLAGLFHPGWESHGPIKKSGTSFSTS